MRPSTERAAAKADLVNCPEPEIKDLVYQTQRASDEAMSERIGNRIGRGPSVTRRAGCAK